MALSAASALHYWSARYGAIPIIGGKPVHTRASAGSWIDQQGVLQNAVVNTPRFEWATIVGERRQVMRLEPARTNSLLSCRDMSQSDWAKTNVTATRPGIQAGVDGQLDKSSLVTATAINGQVIQSLAAGSGIARTNGLWLRRRTGSGVIEIIDGNGSAWWPVAVTDKWQHFNAPGPSGTARYGGFRLGTSGDSVEADFSQLDDAPSASSSILTTAAAATRAKDSFYWDLLPASAIPQAFALYVGFVEKGTKLVSGQSAIYISDAAASNARFIIDTTGTYYEVSHRTAGGTVTSVLGYAVAESAFVELVAILQSDGKVKILVGVGGVYQASTTLSSALTLAASWSAPRLWLNGAPTVEGLGLYTDVKMVKLGDLSASLSDDPAIFAELQGFELSPNGEMIS